MQEQQLNEREESAVLCWTVNENTDPFPVFRVIVMNVVSFKVMEEADMSIKGEEERTKEEKVSEVPMNVPLPRERRDGVCVYEVDDSIVASLISSVPSFDVIVTNEHGKLAFTDTVRSLRVRAPVPMLNTEVAVEEKEEVRLKVVVD